MLGAIFGLIFLATIVALCWLDDRSRARDVEAFAREIAHLPAEVQVELWASYYRHEAERDLL